MRVVRRTAARSHRRRARKCSQMAQMRLSSEAHPASLPCWMNPCQPHFWQSMDGVSVGASSDPVISQVLPPWTGHGLSITLHSWPGRLGHSKTHQRRSGVRSTSIRTISPSTVFCIRRGQAARSSKPIATIESKMNAAPPFSSSAQSAYILRPRQIPPLRRLRANFATSE